MKLIDMINNWKQDREHTKLNIFNYYKNNIPFKLILNLHLFYYRKKNTVS